MPSELTRHKLPGAAQQLVCQLLAGFAHPREVQAAVEKEFGIRISRETIYYYRRSERWRERIHEIRAKLDENLGDLPIASRYWRMKQRESMVNQARTLPKPDLSAARGLLQDAAREIDALQADETTPTSQINIQMVNQLLQLPDRALDVYLRTGRLPPSSYLSDVPVDGIDPAESPPQDGE